MVALFLIPYIFCCSGIARDWTLYCKLEDPEIKVS